jgi:predicted GIY-YIG superfamily endonuclease
VKNNLLIIKIPFKITTYHKTDDLSRRFKERNTGQSNYTRTGIPWKLVYHHQFEDSKSGLRAERWIITYKSLNSHHK